MIGVPPPVSIPPDQLIELLWILGEESVFHVAIWDVVSPWVQAAEQFVPDPQLGPEPIASETLPVLSSPDLPGEAVFSMERIEAHGVPSSVLRSLLAS
jgi:hypothetical protein